MLYEYKVNDQDLDVTKSPGPFENLEFKNQDISFGYASFGIFRLSRLRC